MSDWTANLPPADWTSDDGNVLLYRGDCLEVMPSLDAGGIDMVMTDPPYGTTACKWDSIIPLKPMWEQLNRLAKPNAAIVMTASQPFTTALIASNIKMFNYCWVWHKRVSANFGAAKYQPMKTHEDVVVFGGKYKPQMIKGRRRMRGGMAANGQANGGMKPVYYESDERYPASVLDIASERGLHPTQKPVALMEYLIKTYTNEGDTVLDFTMGSGTTGVACVKTCRKFIGIELSDQYFDIAVKRIKAAYADAGLFTGAGHTCERGALL
jgi:site-specific DNA-methyltransferase (adenine-specific)